MEKKGVKSPGSSRKGLPAKKDTHQPSSQRPQERRKGGWSTEDKKRGGK